MLSSMWQTLEGNQSHRFGGPTGVGDIANDHTNHNNNNNIIIIIMINFYDVGIALVYLPDRTIFSAHTRPCNTCALSKSGMELKHKTREQTHTSLVLYL